MRTHTDGRIQRTTMPETHGGIHPGPREFGVKHHEKPTKRHYQADHPNEHPRGTLSQRYTGLLDQHLGLGRMRKRCERQERERDTNASCQPSRCQQSHSERQGHQPSRCQQSHSGRRTP